MMQLVNFTVLDCYTRIYHFDKPSLEEVQKLPFLFRLFNQLARRNINAITKNDLIGRRYSVEKHIVGSNQHTSNSQKSWNQNDTSLRTRGKIADQLNVGEATVQRAEKLSKAIDIITAKPIGLKSLFLYLYVPIETKRLDLI